MKRFWRWLFPELTDAQRKSVPYMFMFGIGATAGISIMLVDELSTILILKRKDEIIHNNPFEVAVILAIVLVALVCLLYFAHRNPSIRAIRDELKADYEAHKSKNPLKRFLRIRGK